MLSDESPLTLEWTLRQPKDAEWCWPSHHFYPCGCKQDDWDDDYEVDEQDDWCCELCHPSEFTRRESDARDQARRRDHVEDEAFAARTRWLRHYGWLPPENVGLGLESLAACLKQFYITPMREQLNRPSPLLEAIVAEKNFLYGVRPCPPTVGKPQTNVDWPATWGSVRADVARLWGRLRKMGRVVS